MYVFTYMRQLLFAFAVPPVQSLIMLNCLHYSITRDQAKFKHLHFLMLKVSHSNHLSRNYILLL